MTRQIPYLHPHHMADGRTSWHWKPSPRLRKAGWTNLALGVTDGKRPTAAIVAKAIERNDALAQWEAGASNVAAAAVAPRKWRFTDLISAYRQSSEFAELAKATRGEYETRLGQLEFWAEDGQLPIRHIDRQLVQDLKDALLAPDEEGKRPLPFKCASTLRVLRLLMNWAVSRGLLDRDPTAGVKIPTPPSRTAKLDWRAVSAVADLAEAGGDDIAARYFRLGFWTTQRQADLIERANRLAWRTFENFDARDRSVLADPKGEVRGFRLQQRKTGKWVDCPLPAWLHADVEAAFAVSQYLFPQPGDPSKPMPRKALHRRLRHWLDEAGWAGHQPRDLRRSGMSWMEDMGANRSDICAISGHQLFGHASILDTYMPPDTRGAVSAVAAAERTRRRREAQEAAGQ